MTPMKNMFWMLSAALLAAACGNARLAAQGGGQAQAAASVKVYKSRGAIQCQSKGTPPETMREELVAAGITVMAHACGTNGRLYPAMCGRPDDKINIFTIPADQLAQAAALNFQPLSALPEAQETACP